jgi:heme a synthase
MLLVLVMGAAVTNTGSAQGCGRSWPLCNGQFVPEFTVATAIEYSHRAVTGIESLLVVALVASMLMLWRRQREVIVLAMLMLVTLLLQAGLGAGAVLWPQSPVVLATHFGVSLVAFASTYLSAAVVFERTRCVDRVGQPSNSSPAFRYLTIAVVTYVLGVVYLGAYVRHAGVSLACFDWPLCNGQIIPPLLGPTGIAFAHRVAAAGAVVLLGFLMVRARAQHLAGSQATHAFGLSILQALSGALVVWTYLGLFSTLLHAALMGLLAATLSYVLLLAVRQPERNDSVPDVFSLSDAAARGLQPEHAASSPHALATTTSGNASTTRRSAVADNRHG